MTSTSGYRRPRGILRSTRRKVIRVSSEMHLEMLYILTFLLIRKKTVDLDHVVTQGFPIGMPMAEPGKCMGQSLVEIRRIDPIR